MFVQWQNILKLEWGYNDYSLNHRHLLFISDYMNYYLFKMTNKHKNYEMVCCMTLRKLFPSSFVQLILLAKSYLTCLSSKQFKFNFLKKINTFNLLLSFQSTFKNAFIYSKTNKSKYQFHVRMQLELSFFIKLIKTFLSTKSVHK